MSQQTHVRPTRLGQRPARAAANRCFGDGWLHLLRHKSGLCYFLMLSSCPLFSFATAWPAQGRQGAKSGVAARNLLLLFSRFPDWVSAEERRRPGTACQASQEPPRQLPGSTCQV